MRPYLGRGVRGIDTLRARERGRNDAGSHGPRRPVVRPVRQDGVPGPRRLHGDRSPWSRPTARSSPARAGCRTTSQRARETPLSHSFCQHVVADQAPLIVARRPRARPCCATTSRSATSASSRTPAGRSPTTPAPSSAPCAPSATSPHDWTDGPARDARGPGGRLLGRAVRARPARPRAVGARGDGSLAPQPGAARPQRGAVGDPHHGRRRPGGGADRRRAPRLPARRDLAARTTARPAGPTTRRRS